MDAHHRKNTADWHADLMETASQDQQERSLAFRWRDDPAESLRLYEEAHAHGLIEAVLPAIFCCVINDLPFPEWLKKAFCLQYLRGFHGRLKSWDDAFGRPRTKAKYQREFRARYKAAEAYDYVVEAKSRGEPITDELFEKIGRERGLGGREITKKFYTAVRKRKRD